MFIYFLDEDSIAAILNPLAINQTLKAISNNPPGIERKTPRPLAKSSEIVPIIKMMYPIKPQTEKTRETIFDLNRTAVNSNPPRPVGFKNLIG